MRFATICALLSLFASPLAVIAAPAAEANPVAHYRGDGNSRGDRDNNDRSRYAFNGDDDNGEFFGGEDGVGNSTGPITGSGSQKGVVGTEDAIGGDDTENVVGDDDTESVDDDDDDVTPVQGGNGQTRITSTLSSRVAVAAATATSD